MELNKKIRFKSVKLLFQRFLMVFVAMIASMAMIACGESEGEGNGGGENGGGNGGSGVTGKRIKSITESYLGSAGGPVRSEFSYNSDGTLKQMDSYDESNKRVMYSTFTHNSDGVRTKYEQYDIAYTNATSKYEIFYNANKTLQKMEGTISIGGVIASTSTHEYTFQNGRKTKEVLTVKAGPVTQRIDIEYQYDAQGRRTITTQTPAIGIPTVYTRTYNSDGTLQKATYTADGRVITKTVTWENGKSTVDEDIFFAF